jgi:hypothetical protein
MGNMENIRNIVISNGDIIDNLKVVSDVYYKEVGKDRKKRRYFKVLCLNCNNETEIREISLKKHKTGICKHCRSNKGRMKGNPKNNNTYTFCDNFVIGYTNLGEDFYFDKEDYDLIKNYTWRINANGYVETQKNKKKILMHRLVSNAPYSVIIDHKNRMRNYNLKENLSLVSKKENNQNHSTYKNNTSGVTGVSWDKGAKKWRVSIGINNKRIYGGLFNNIKDAINKRLELEKKYFTYVQNINCTV